MLRADPAVKNLTTENQLTKPMKRFWYGIFDRGLDSAAVWNLAPLFAVGTLTRAQHLTEVNSLSGLIFACAQAEDTLDTARDSRNAARDTVREICTRGCNLISSYVPAGDLSGMSDKIQAVYHVRGESFRAVEYKGLKLATAWLAVNAHRASLTPALPPLLVGTLSVQEFQSSVGNYAQLVLNASEKETPVKTTTKALRAAVTRVDKNNKRWHKAWKGQFAADSVERAALSQVDTGPSQTLPGQGVILGAEVLPNLVVKPSFGAARATSFTLLYKGPGDGAFTVLAANITERNFQHTVAAPGEHLYKVIGHNSTGSGTESAPFAVTVAQEAAA